MTAFSWTRELFNKRHLASLPDLRRRRHNLRQGCHTVGRRVQLAGEHARPPPGLRCALGWALALACPTPRTASPAGSGAAPRHGGSACAQEKPSGSAAPYAVHFPHDELHGAQPRRRASRWRRKGHHRQGDGGGRGCGRANAPDGHARQYKQCTLSTNTLSKSMGRVGVRRSRWLGRERNPSSRQVRADKGTHMEARAHAEFHVTGGTASGNVAAHLM